MDIQLTNQWLNENPSIKQLYIPNQRLLLSKNDIVKAISTLVTDIVDSSTELPSKKTIFLSSTIPKISISDYIARINQYTECSVETWIIALIYLNLYSSIYQLSLYNIHRLFITSIMIAMKYNDDKFHSSKYFSQVGAVPLSDLKKFEIEFLKVIGFSVHVADLDYFAMLQQLSSIKFQEESNYAQQFETKDVGQFQQRITR